MCKFVEGEIEINFDKRDVIEILQVILFIVIGLSLRWLFLHFADKGEDRVINGLTAGFIIGTIHIFSSNLLSKLYNLERIMCPFKFFPIITPKGVRIIGGIILLLVAVKIVRLLSV